MSLAHKLGHALHFELARARRALQCQTSIPMLEVASKIVGLRRVFFDTNKQITADAGSFRLDIAETIRHDAEGGAPFARDWSPATGGGNPLSNGQTYRLGACEMKGGVAAMVSVAEL
jgi:hypothetical protein